MRNLLKILENNLPLSFLVIVLFSFFVFYLGIISFPRQDHLTAFMLERDLVKSDFDFFVRSFFYSRLREIGPGDYFLFRPFTTGLQGILDIFYRENLFVPGLLSIFFHALCTFTLFLTLRALQLPTPLLFILTLSFLVQYSGSEAILWRHISGYLLALTFFGLGTLILFKENTKPLSKMKSFKVFLCFLISSLFHEVGILTFLVILFAAKILKKRNNTFFTTNENKIFKYTVLAFFLLNIADLIWHQPKSLLGPADRGLRGGLWMNIQSILGSMLELFSLDFLAFFAPWTIKIFLQKHFPEVILLLLALGLLIYLVKVYPNIKNNILSKIKPSHKKYFYLYSFFFLSLFLGVSLGRGSQRGTSYFLVSTYYLYLSNFALTILIGILLTIFHKRALLWILMINIPISYFLIQNQLKPKFDFEWKAAKNSLELKEFYTKNPYCIESIDSGLSKFELDTILARYKCKNLTGKKNSRLVGATDDKIKIIY